MLGDFNIFNWGDVTLAAIEEAGLRIPDALQSLPGSNVKSDKYDDQIAYFKELTRIRPTGRAGVFDYYQHVYRLEDGASYAEVRAAKPGNSFQDWRTYRMSDHLPMWIEMGIDDSDACLDSLLACECGTDGLRPALQGQNRSDALKKNERGALVCTVVSAFGYWAMNWSSVTPVGRLPSTPICVALRSFSTLLTLKSKRTLSPRL
jgi:hypothetical protein